MFRLNPVTQNVKRTVRYRYWPVTARTRIVHVPAHGRRGHRRSRRAQTRDGAVHGVGGGGNGSCIRRSRQRRWLRPWQRPAGKDVNINKWVQTQSTYIFRVQSSVWRLPNYWSPTPLSNQRVCSPPAPKAGGEHTRRAVVNISEDARYGLASYSIIPLRVQRTSIKLKGAQMLQTILWIKIQIRLSHWCSPRFEI
jgi:hypothetical protein